MVAMASKVIAPTCPYEDPILGNGAAAEVAYMASTDQHMVPLEGMDRMLDLSPWDGLLLVRHLGRPKDARVALLLSSECPPSAPNLEGTSGTSFLAEFLKQPLDVCTCLVEDQMLAWL
jgi:hypothetical protein